MIKKTNSCTNRSFSCSIKVIYAARAATAARTTITATAPTARATNAARAATAVITTAVRTAYAAAPTARATARAATIATAPTGRSTAPIWDAITADACRGDIL